MASVQESTIGLDKDSPFLLANIKLAWSEWLATERARFLVLAAELGLVVLIIRLFALEDVTFGNLAILIWAGFTVHHLLPMRLRMPFFVALSLASLFLVAGLKLGACVVVGACVFIGICHLPIRITYRIGLLVLVSVAVAWLRVSLLMSPQGAMVWAILSSMFMFRVIVYIYDMHHKTAPIDPIHVGAYFLMLPSASFPLFPVVDYKTFCSTYYNCDPLRIYQSGLRWIVRGIFQILLYRVIYQVGLVDPLGVTSLGGVARFTVSTYLLYLQVSGRFHVIIGMLHLFGFNLPETHHRYLLATSFTDFWRRINIYWKDFIMKIFFYPSYCCLKRFGATPALILSTLYAFFMTWALHSYQSFWLRGSFIFTWQDIIFWSILAGLVLINVLYEARYGRRRSLTKPVRTLRSRAMLGLRTVGMFVLICMLWTLWTCHSASELTWLASAAHHTTPWEVAIILAVLIGLGVAAILWGDEAAERTENAAGTAAVESGTGFGRDSTVLGLQCMALLLLAVLPRTLAIEDPTARVLLTSIQSDQMNLMDLEGLRRGYYEDLDVPRRLAQLVRLSDKRPQDWREGSEKAVRNINAFQAVEPVPSVRAFFWGSWVTHNRWGMRDRECEKAKPPGVVRVALFGSSNEYGFGVGDDDPYPSILEDLINRTEGRRPVRLEILNFSLPSHSTFQYLHTLEHRALQFDPDAVIVAINAYESSRTLQHLAWSIRSGHDLPYECLKEVANRAEVHQEMPQELIRARLRPHIRDLSRQAYQILAGICQKRGLSVSLVFRPEALKWNERHTIENEENRRDLLRLAEETSLPFLDLSAAFDGVEYRESLIVAPWDFHINAKGQRLLAEELYRILRDREGLGLLRPSGETASR